MGSRRGSTEFTAVRSLAWPLGLAVGGGAFLATSDGVPWLVAHQSGPIAQGLNRGVSAVLATVAWIVFAMYCLVAKGWRQFESLVGEAFRRPGYAVEETDLCGADSGIAMILRKDCRRALVQSKQ